MNGLYLHFEKILWYIEEKLVMDIYKSIQSYHVCTCYTYIYNVSTRHITEKCCHCGQRAVLHVLVIQFLSTTERWRFEVTTEPSGTIHG